jgi:hypothetical protein
MTKLSRLRRPSCQYRRGGRPRIPALPLSLERLEDRTLPSVSLVSINSLGTDNGNTYSDGLTTLSADGRFVAFLSKASNLTAIPDNNNAVDVFVRDLQMGTTTLVSVNQDGSASGNAASSPFSTPSISAPARRLLAMPEMASWP